MPVAALSVPKDYLRYLPAKEKSAPSAPMTAVNTEIHAVNSFGLSKEEPLFSSLIGSFSSGFAVDSSSLVSSSSASLSVVFVSVDEPMPEKGLLEAAGLFSGASSADATEVPAKATATAVAPATSALREKSFMMKSFRGVKVR